MTALWYKIELLKLNLKSCVIKFPVLIWCCPLQQPECSCVKPGIDFAIFFLQVQNPKEFPDIFLHLCVRSSEKKVLKMTEHKISFHFQLLGKTIHVAMASKSHYGFYCLLLTTLFLSIQVINWKLDNIGMNPTAEAYLVLHRYGSVSLHQYKRPSSVGNQV